MPARCALLLVAVLLSGCGYVGEPLPPTLDIPRPVADLRVAQVEDKAQLDFTIPELTTEGLPVVLRKVELLAGPYADDNFDADRWAGSARALGPIPLRAGPVHLEIEVGEWVGKEVFFRVRLVGRKGRPSEWSEFKTLRIVPPLAAPAELGAETTAEGVRLWWNGPSEPAGVEFRLLRSAKDQPEQELAVTTEREWLDRTVRYEETYSYRVQSLFRRQGAQAVSRASTPVKITPVDRFAPLTPRGISALAAPASIELSWDQNTEPDLAGYIIYRADGEKPFAPLAKCATPAYSDQQVQPGQLYRYAVSAFDQAGNESNRSEAVEVALP